MDTINAIRRGLCEEKEHQQRDVLYKCIMMLEKVEKVTGSSRFNKSYLLEIAILDLINRYE